MKGLMIRVSGWTLAVSLAVMLVTGSAMAGGITLLEFSTKGLGNAFSATATADQASTIFFNPAGLTRLQSPEAMATGHVIFIQADFDNEGSTTADIPLLGSDPLTGGGDDGGTTVFVPSFFASMPLTDRLVAGLGVHSPYGLATDYGDDWVGRYHATSSDLITVNINPSIGVKVLNWLSLGFGVSAQYAYANLQNEIDFGSIAGLSTDTSPAFGGPTNAAAQAADGDVENDGDDWGFGFNIGVMVEPTDRTRFGVHYRSKIDYTLEGDADFDTPDASAFTPFVLAPGLDAAVANGLAGTFSDTDIEADITLPETVSIHGYHEFNDQWAVMADVTWTNYSRLDEIRIEFDNGLPDGVTTLDWEDTWRYSIGLNYKPVPNMVLRCGAAYDESPVPDEDTRTARVPDDDRIWAAVGFGYTWFDRLTVDVGYAHLFIGDVDINQTTTGNPMAMDENFFRGNLIGEYDASADIVGVEVRYVF